MLINFVVFADTTVVKAGISFNTTTDAPIRLHFPIVIGPRIVA